MKYTLKTFSRQNAHVQDSLPVLYFLDVFGQFPSSAVGAEWDFHPGSWTKLNDSDSHLRNIQEATKKNHIDLKHITALNLHLLRKLQVDGMLLADRVWADVQSLTQFQYTMTGPLEAALPNTVWAVHQKEDIYSCRTPHHCTHGNKYKNTQIHH